MGFRAKSKCRHHNIIMYNTINGYSSGDLLKIAFYSVITLLVKKKEKKTLYGHKQKEP